ncbi:hypothetical protein EDD21DRAFT_444738 [Dissophora ornata]|nr:hypothetical protein EDD21DRAFT_444738 [Dissophora ornata]
MSLFKSSKNQSASASTTPRSSMNEQRRVQVTKMTQDQVLEMLHKKAMPNPSSFGPQRRVYTSRIHTCRLSEHGSNPKRKNIDRRIKGPEEALGIAFLWSIKRAWSSVIVLAGRCSCIDDRGVAAGEVAAEADWFLEDLKKAMVDESTNQQTLPSIRPTSQHSLRQIITPLSTIMALFKFSKNQSGSATTTPRSSMNEQRPVQVNKMTQDQALEMLHKKAMPNASVGPFIR